MPEILKFSFTSFVSSTFFFLFDIPQGMVNYGLVLYIQALNEDCYCASLVVVSVKMRGELGKWLRH